MRIKEEDNSEVYTLYKTITYKGSRSRKSSCKKHLPARESLFTKKVSHIAKNTLTPMECRQCGKTRVRRWIRINRKGAVFRALLQLDEGIVRAKEIKRGIIETTHERKPKPGKMRRNRKQGGKEM